MSLTSPGFLALLILAAVVLPLCSVLVWFRRRGPSRWVVLVARLGLVFLSQFVAMSALFVWVNDSYAFYTSWADLFGRTGPTAHIRSGGLVSPGEGRVQVLAVSSTTARNRQILLWYPPQYDQPRYARTRFPVLMVLPGQPSTPERSFAHFDFGAVASQEIAAGRVRPFVAVFPPLMTDPPRDTECTDVPGGPQAYRWLTRDVPAAVLAHARTVRAPRWGLLGYSTGGFCAAKLLLSQPQEFGAAATLGGYFTPVEDRTTGDLFRGSAALREDNSPLWLYEHRGLRGHLLIVAGREDGEAYAASRQMQHAAGHDPQVSYLMFPSGGHNYRNYRIYLPRILDWLATEAGAS